MSGTVITAKAVITAEDKTGAAFDKIGKKFAQLGKGAKVSAEVDKLAASLRRADSGLRAIDQHRSNRGGFYTAKNAMREAQVAADGASKALAAAAKPTRALRDEAQRTATALDGATKAFERQKLAAFSSRRSLSDAGVAADRLISEQTRLRNAVEATSRAIDRQVRIDAREGRIRQRLGAVRSEADIRADRLGTRRTEVRDLARSRRPGRIVDGTLQAEWDARDSSRSARAVRHQERLGARDLVLGGAAVAGGHAVKEGLRESLITYREFDKASRATEAFGNYSKTEMAGIIDMAIHGGATSKYNDIQWLEGAKALGGRGVKAKSTMGILPEAAQYGMALDVNLPDAVAGIEGSLFGFQRDLSDPAKAAAAARRTADVQVRAAKAFGLTHNDLKGVYEYGALAAQTSGLSEEKLLAFGGLGKKLNIEGSAQGNAFRAMTGKLLAPTQKGREALAGVGIDYAGFQQMPERLSVDSFGSMIAQQYGVKLNGKARAKLEAGFTNKDTFGSSSAFAVMVRDALKGQVGISGAKDLNKVAGSAERFRRNNVEKVDANGLFDAIMKKIQGGNLALANSIFGEKQGTRIMAAMRDEKLWTESVDKVERTPEGFAKEVADKRMAGFDGAISRLEGARKNLETAIGRSFDNGGENGPLTVATNASAKLVQAFAELDAKVLATGTVFAGIATSAMTLATALNIGAKLGIPGAATAATGAGAAVGMLPQLALMFGGAHLGMSLGQGLVNVGGVASGRFWQPKSVEDVADLQARKAEVEAQIAGIEGRVHPSIRGNANPELDRLRSEVADLRNRISAGPTSVAEALPGGVSIGSQATRAFGPGGPTGAKMTWESPTVLPPPRPGAGPILPPTLTMPEISAKLDGRVPVDITGKLEPVKLEGQGTITVVAGPGTQVVNTTSSGNIRVQGGGSSGVSMPGAQRQGFAPTMSGI